MNMNFGTKKETNNTTQTNTLHEKDIEKIKKMPYLETKYSKSKDGQFVIVKTIITDIKPIKYWEMVFSDE